MPFSILRSLFAKSSLEERRRNPEAVNDHFLPLFLMQNPLADNDGGEDDDLHDRFSRLGSSGRRYSS